MYFRSTFCYICRNSLYIPTAIDKSNALTKKDKKAGVCGSGRAVISLSNRFICLPTYLPTSAHSARVKTEVEKATSKKWFDQTRGQTRVSISMAFQQWRELRELKGLKSDTVRTNNSWLFTFILIMLGVLKHVNEI